MNVLRAVVYVTIDIWLAVGSLLILAGFIGWIIEATKDRRAKRVSTGSAARRVQGRISPGVRPHRAPVRSPDRPALHLVHDRHLELIRD